MQSEEIRGRIIAGLPHAKAVAMRSGAQHKAWAVVADAEAYVRGAPTFVPPEEIAAALAAYPPIRRSDEMRAPPP
jgi:hypothetical protein